MLHISTDTFLLGNPCLLLFAVLDIVDSLPATAGQGLAAMEKGSVWPLFLGRSGWTGQYKATLIGTTPLDPTPHTQFP